MARSNQILVPQARAALDKFKWEAAQQAGITLQPGQYGGDIPSKVWGSVGGQMVRQMIQSYQQSVAGGQAVPTATAPIQTQYKQQ